jgi:hypothetical protein
VSDVDERTTDAAAAQHLLGKLSGYRATEPQAIFRAAYDALFASGGELDDFWQVPF